MKRFLFAGAMAAALSTAALAQYTEDKLEVTPYNIAVRGGAFLPLEDNLSDVADIFINIGLEYTFARQYLRGSDTYISIDWFGKGISGDQGSVFPIAVNQRFYTNRTWFGVEEIGRASCRE